jgi:hypothetical protein
MLHSECEAVDYVLVPANTEFEPSGTEGTESAWFVLGGSAELGTEQVSAGHVILSPASARTRFVAGPDGVELLWIAVLPDEVSRALPARKPVVS